MTRDLLEIQRQELEGLDVLVIQGELDLTCVGLLEESVDQTTTPCVILDLSGLEFIDSAGIRMIDQVQRRLGEAGRSLIVVAPSDSRAAWTFRVAGFTDGFALTSMEQALLEATRRPATSH